MLYFNQTNISIITSNWALSNLGNYTVSEYYTGIEAGNPSGTTTNLKYLKLYDSNDVLKFTLEFSYDITDNIIKEESI